jgi:hypothetical protein
MQERRLDAIDLCRETIPDRAGDSAPTPIATPAGAERFRESTLPLVLLYMPHEALFTFLLATGEFVLAALVGIIAGLELDPYRCTGQF